MPRAGLTNPIEPPPHRLHAGRVRDRGQLRTDPVRRAEHHATAGAEVRRSLEVLGKGRVRYAEHHQVDRLVDVIEARHAGLVEDPGVLRVDEVHARPRGAAQDLPRHPIAERALPDAGADDRDRARLKQTIQRAQRVRHRACSTGSGRRTGSSAQPRLSPMSGLALVPD